MIHRRSTRYYCTNTRVASLCALGEATKSGGGLRYFSFLFMHTVRISTIDCPLNARIYYAQNANVNATITISVITNYKNPPTFCRRRVRQDGGVISRVL